MTAALGGVLAGALVLAAIVVAPGRQEAADGSGLPASTGGPDGWLPGLRGLHPTSERPVPVSRTEVIDALVLLALAYRSGLPTCDVLEAVAARAAGPPGRDLRQVSAALRWGATETEAWAAVDDRWAPAARAVALAARAGVAPGPLLLRAADDLGSAELERLEVSAARVSVRLVLPLGLVLLPAFVLTTVLPIVAALAQQVLSRA